MPQKSSLTILANAFVSTKSIGGGDRFIIQVTPSLSLVVQTTIITPEVGNHHWEKTMKDNPTKAHFVVLKPSIFDNRDHPVAIMTAYFLRSIQNIRFLKKSTPTHLVTASHYLPDILPASWLKRRDPKVRWVARIYHLVPPPHRRAGSLLVNTVVYLTQMMMLRFLKHSDLVVADNPKTITQLKDLGFRKSQVALLPSGIPYQKIRNHKPKRRWSFDAAYVGRLDPHRGIFDLPPIWKKVVKVIPKAILAVTGYGPKSSTEKLKKEFREQGLEKNVKFLGFLPHDEETEHPLYDLLHSTKALLLPIHEGGWPLTIAEAMAAGVPVIAYSLPSFGTTYKQGFLTSPLKNVDAFVANTLTLLTEEARREKMSQEALEQAKHFDFSQVAIHFRNLVF